MARFQTLILFLVSVFTHSAIALWGIQTGFSGFQGTISLGVTYKTASNHVFDLGVGRYSTRRGEAQINFGYTYSPWRMAEEIWSPIAVGIFGVRSLDDDYFVRTPPEYPYEGYYEQTGFRLGLRAGTGVRVKQINVIYEISILDSGVVVAFNNDFRYIDYFLSSGLRFQYEF